MTSHNRNALGSSKYTHAIEISQKFSLFSQMLCTQLTMNAESSLTTTAEQSQSCSTQENTRTAARELGIVAQLACVGLPGVGV